MQNWREQRDESVRERFHKPIKPQTRNHAIYWKAMETSTITICVGPAGTGKTFGSCAVAAAMLHDNRIDKVIITRPLVLCQSEGSDIGALPGDLNDKFGPYVMPLLEAFEDIMGSKQEVLKYIAAEKIKMLPLEYARGSSFKRSFIICDEAQNARYNQLHMLMTRIDIGTRLVVTGDIRQSDVFMKRNNPLEEIIKKFRPQCHPEISMVKLGREDCMRPGIVNWVDERLLED